MSNYSPVHIKIHLPALEFAVFIIVVVVVAVVVVERT